MGRWAGSSEGAVEDEIARRFKWLAPEATAPAPSLASEAPAPSQSPGEDGALAEAPAPPTASAAAEAPAPARPLAGRDAGRGDGPDDAWDDEEDEDEREHHRRRSQEEADEAIAKAGGGPRRSPHQSPAMVRTRATLMSSPSSSGSQHALLDLLAYQHGHDDCDGAVGSGGEPAASGDDDDALPFDLPVPDPIYFCGRCAAWLPEREFPPAQLARPARDRRCGACEGIALGELSAAVYIDVHENLAAMAIPPDTLPLPKRPGSSAPAGRAKFEKSEKRRA
jgi:hypothetical protein